jgi:hypothetical protein
MTNAERSGRRATGRALVGAYVTVLALAGCGARSALVTSSTEVGDASALADAVAPPLDGSTPLDGTVPSFDASVCPRGVLTTTSAATEFAIDGPFVYYLDSLERGIRRIPKVGGVGELVVAEDRSVHNVVVDGEFVYWSAGTITSGISVYRVQKVPSKAPIVLSTAKHGTEVFNPDRLTFAVSVNDRFVSWAAPWGGIQWVDKQTPTSTWRLDPLQAFSNLHSLDVRSDATHTYWATGTFIVRVPLGPVNGTVETVFKVSLDRIRAFAIDDTDLYWTLFNGWDSDLLRTSKGALSLETILATHVTGSALAVDADYVYVTSPAGIVKVSKSSRAVTLVEPGVSDARSIAVDGDCLYYLSGEPNGAIVRVPK